MFTDNVQLVETKPKDALNEGYEYGSMTRYTRTLLLEPRANVYAGDEYYCIEYDYDVQANRFNERFYIRKNFVSYIKYEKQSVVVSFFYKSAMNDTIKEYFVDLLTDRMRKYLYKKLPDYDTKYFWIESVRQTIRYAFKLKDGVYIITQMNKYKNIGNWKGNRPYHQFVASLIATREQYCSNDDFYVDGCGQKYLVFICDTLANNSEKLFSMFNTLLKSKTIKLY